MPPAASILARADFGHALNLHRESDLDFATAQGWPPDSLVCGAISLSFKCFARNDASGLESFKLVKIDFIEFNPVGGSESFTTHERQAAEERQVATLAVQVST